VPTIAEAGLPGYILSDGGESSPAGMPRQSSTGCQRDEDDLELDEVKTAVSQERDEADYRSG